MNEPSWAPAGHVSPSHCRNASIELSVPSGGVVRTSIRMRDNEGTVDVDRMARIVSRLSQPHIWMTSGCWCGTAHDRKLSVEGFLEDGSAFIRKKGDR